jgi:hypothetical protein
MPAFTKAMLEKLGLTPAATTLQAVPQKEKGKAVPHTTVYHKNAVHQADLIFLPHDKVGKKTFKYALVVVDLHSGLTDAEPLQDKTAENTAAAIKVIYRRSILDFPNRLETDPGSEFKSAFAALMIEHNVELRYGKKGRHRQQSVVENRNYAIGYALNLRMASIEQITGQTSRDWVSFLPTVISAFNEQTHDKASKEKKPKDPADLGPRCTKKGGCEMLEEGTKVRVILEEPRDNVTDEVLHGKFRAGDKRWDDRVRKIYQVLVRPDQPVMYIVTSPESDKPDKVAYTRQQLQVVQSNEPEPDANKLKISKTNQDFRVHSLQERRKKGTKVEFLVRWIGYPDKKDWTWESRAKLMKSGEGVKQFIKDFEAA